MVFIAVPKNDTIGALVPHTLEEPIVGRSEGPLAGLTFMVKDLFAIKGRKVSNGNPDFYHHATPGARDRAGHRAPAGRGRQPHRHQCLRRVLLQRARHQRPLRPADQCPRRQPCHRRLVLRLGGRGGRRHVRLRARHRHRRLDPRAGVLLRARMACARPMAASTRTAPPPWRRATTRWAFSPRDAKLARKLGQLLLEGESRDRAHHPADPRPGHRRRVRGEHRPSLWQMLDKLAGAIPKPEQVEIAGEDIVAWRKAFATIQGFEIQSTLLPFVQSHNVNLGPGIKERFEIAAGITFDEVEAARAVRGQVTKRLKEIVQPGTVIVLPTTPDPAAGARYPRRRLLRRVPHADPAEHLPCRPCRPAADLDSHGQGLGLPGGPLLHRLGGRRRGPARPRRDAGTLYPRLT